MSQANDHANQPQANHCTKCKVMYGNVQSQKMCSVCYQDKSQVPTKQPMTPIKRIEIAKRQMQLLKAPKKTDQDQQSESAGDQQEQEEEHECDGCEDYEENENEVQIEQFSIVKEQEQQSSGQDDSNEQNEAQTTQINHKHEANISKGTKIIAKQQASFLNYKKPILVFRHNHEVKIQELEEPPLRRNFSQFLDQREDLQVIKGKCKSCSKRTGLLGVICSHCSYEYCNAHRLPQNHKCKVDFVEQFKEKRKQLMLQCMRKHKGKIRQI